jgi:hypothetical protein
MNWILLPKLYECIFIKNNLQDTLKQLRLIGEGDQELEERLVQEELTQKVTHMHRKAMWVTSLYSYPYLN